MGPLTVRTFKSADTDAIVELWRVCELIVPDNDPYEDIARKCTHDPDWFLVGEIGGMIIATCMVGYDGHRGGINYLAVHPDHRNAGYARTIMQSAERLLEEIDCPKVNLLVRTTNLAVLDFYRSIGFTDNYCMSLGKRFSSDAQ